MLDTKTTLDLITKAKKGDESAKTKLFEENSPLIKSVIKRFLHKGIEYDDLYQIGTVGLLKAINNFDEKFNVKFSTYVVPMVIGEIKRFMRDDGAIKVSRTIKTLNLKIRKFIEEFNRENYRKPTPQEIAKKFDIDEAEVIFTMDSAAMPISIYTPFEDDSKSLLLIDRLNPDNFDEKMIDNIMLKEVLKSLDKRDKKIILLRFFRDKTQSEIAKVLGVSQVQVSRLENKVLEKIKDKLSVM